MALLTKRPSAPQEAHVRFRFRLRLFVFAITSVVAIALIGHAYFTDDKDLMGWTLAIGGFVFVLTAANVFLGWIGLNAVRSVGAKTQKLQRVMAVGFGVVTIYLAWELLGRPSLSSVLSGAGMRLFGPLLLLYGYVLYCTFWLSAPDGAEPSDRF